MAQLLRSALYVDGFNLYHAIDKLNEPHLKWLNLWALGERILPRSQEELVAVHYFTALLPGAPEKNKRHAEYMTALKCYGVKICEGHFTSETVDCRKCKHVWLAPKEKESDVNLALTLIDDGYHDIFDVAYMVTADSDHGATARLFKTRFPAKKLCQVLPPGQEASKSILAHTSHKMKLTYEFIEECLLPPFLMTKIGGKDTLRFRRPAEYAPPVGWVNPKDRPKKK